MNAKWTPEEVEKIKQIIMTGDDFTAADHLQFPNRSRYAVINKASLMRKAMGISRPSRIGRGGNCPKSIAAQSATLHLKTIEVANKNNSECFGLSKAQVRAKAVELGLRESF